MLFYYLVKYFVSRFVHLPHPKLKLFLDTVGVISMSVFIVVGNLNRIDVRETFLTTHKATMHPSPVHANVSFDSLKNLKLNTGIILN